MGRKGDTQVQADFAALAGGEELPGIKTASDPVVAAVADYVWANRPRDDRSSEWADSVSAVASNLVDGNDENGEVHFPDAHKVTVVSPEAQVNFGFAGIFSIFGGDPMNKIDVSSDATAALGTPDGYGVWPLYVANPTVGNRRATTACRRLDRPPGRARGAADRTDALRGLRRQRQHARLDHRLRRRRPVGERLAELDHRADQDPR